MSYHKNFINLSDDNKKTIEKYLKFKKIENPEISNRTLRNIKETLKKLANTIKDKKFIDVDTKTMQNFFESISEESYRSRDTYGMHIIPFYRWLHNLDKNTRPDNMKWFKTVPLKTIRRKKDIHAKKSFFITPEEYEKMLTWGNDIFGQINSIWEVYYLSGIRPEELPSMKINDIDIKDGITTIIVTDSKTTQRRIPLPHTPYKLLEYLENHPHKNNKEAYLWFSFKNNRPDEPISIDAIRNRFRTMKQELKLKPTFNLKAFRKTRATIVFATQHLHNLTLKEIGQLFGWTPETTVKRQDEYNLTDQEDIIKKYCNETYIEPTQKQLKKTHIETTEKLKKENIELNQKIGNLEGVVKDLTKLVKGLENVIYDDLFKKEAFQKYREKLLDEEIDINKMYPPEPRTKK